MPLCRNCLLAALACATLIFLLFPSRGFSDNHAAYKDSTLTGNWGGLRTSLANKGIDTEIVYKFDVISNTSGGAKRGTENLDNLDVKMAIDGEKLIGSPGTSALIYFLNNNGSRPGARLVDDAEGVDNIEVRNPGAKLYEAWIQQDFMKGRFSVLAGLYDLNSEFYVTDSSGLFLRPTFGIGTDMGQSGKNGPSIFPVTSAGVRFKSQPTHAFSMQAAVLDGVPGDPNKPRGTTIRFDRHDGALIVGEADYLTGGEAANGKIGLGAWMYTEKFDDFVDQDASGNPVKRMSEGMYILGERRLYREPGDEDRGLTAFLRFGRANGDVNRFDYAWSAGVVYDGLFRGRPKGQLGLSLEGAHNSSKYQQTGGPTKASQMAFELTYHDNVTPWLTVQPDAQYILNPGTDVLLKNAFITGIRITLNF
jgi:porin